MPRKKRFVGFGLGAIQSGLLMAEAFASGNFGQFVVAEVDQTLIDAIRAANGEVVINIAHEHGITQMPITGVIPLHPGIEAEREELIKAIADADELATALPSVAFYERGGSGSPAGLIAAALGQDSVREPKVLYTAENDNHAAEKMCKAIGSFGVAEHVLSGIAVVNTVIGKMCGVITDQPTIERMELATFVPNGDRAILVEAFNRILISEPSVAGVHRGIEVFEAKPDLLPFEEAKLFGHNAMHAWIGYQGRLRGWEVMAEARQDEALMAEARQTFIEECGAGLIHKRGNLNDPLFTPEGFEAYADDLLTRMSNPYLHDLVARVTRDPKRKLGYDDRLCGAMRMTLNAGIQPTRMARGAAAAICCWVAERDGKESVSWSDWPSETFARALLEEAWGDTRNDDALADEVASLIVAAGEAASKQAR